ncbi:MAG: hypothetical protein GXO54_06325 [Chloroflexi bacterium]|nr:hypothetical protein [Chloroflexota bacterium]
MRRFFHFITGAGFGALAGALVALLFAPAQGEEFRRELQARIRALWEQIQQAGEEERRRLEAELRALLPSVAEEPNSDEHA